MLGMVRGRVRRRRAAVLVAALVLVVVVGVVLIGRSDGDGPRDRRAGSELVEVDPSGLLEPEPEPQSYRIDYRVEGYGGEEPVVTSDRLWVRRPWDSRLEVYGGPEPTGQPDAVQIATFGAFRAEADGAEEVVVASPPGAPASDVRVAGALAASLEDGRVELVERRRVAGRTCQVLRTATTFATGDLARPDGAGDHADTCIDAEGLVLEEVLVAGGEVLLRRVATDVEVEPDLDGVSFDAGEQTLDVDQGGGFVAETEPDSRVPGRFFEPTAPSGFSRLGRFAVVPPQAENFTDVERLPRRMTYISDVYVDGSDVVVLDQGGTVGNVDAFPGLQGVDVDVALGPATLTYGASGPAVVVDLGEGRFLRARGTVEPDLLLELLAALEEVEGGELRLLDDG